MKKYIDAGFMEIKVRVARNAPEEADAIRKYASRKPKTKALYKKMKSE